LTIPLPISPPNVFQTPQLSPFSRRKIFSLQSPPIGHFLSPFPRAGPSFPFPYIFLHPPCWLISIFLMNSHHFLLVFWGSYLPGLWGFLTLSRHLNRSSIEVHCLFFPVPWSDDFHPALTIYPLVLFTSMNRAPPNRGLPSHLPRDSFR